MKSMTGYRRSLDLHFQAMASISISDICANTKSNSVMWISIARNFDLLFVYVHNFKEMSEVVKEMVDFSKIPESCISHMLSFTSPRDSTVLSSVSTTFKSAADSDTIWEKFLPPDYQEIFNKMVDDIKFSSKRDLYFKLCSPVLIDGGKMSFQLEKSSGAKCFMISAKELSIAWGDTPEYWEWITPSDLRFKEVAHLKGVWWLEISGKIESKLLSKKTRYAAYLVYKLDEERGGLIYPQEATIRTVVIGTKCKIRLDPCELQGDPCDPVWIDYMQYLRRLSVPNTRDDGWLEIEMGDFYNDNGDDGDIHFRLLETDGWKHGLTVYGIEVRPKK